MSFSDFAEKLWINTSDLGVARDLYDWLNNLWFLDNSNKASSILKSVFGINDNSKIKLTRIWKFNEEWRFGWLLSDLILTINHTDIWYTLSLRTAPWQKNWWEPLFLHSLNIKQLYIKLLNYLDSEYGICIDSLWIIESKIFEWVTDVVGSHFGSWEGEYAINFPK